MAIGTKIRQTFDLIKTIWTTTTIHMSDWFRGLVASWSAPTYENNAIKSNRNPYAYRCKQLIAQNLASIKLLMYYTDSSGDLQEDAKHPFLDVLRRPNPELSQSMFFQTIVHHLHDAGEAFILKSAPSTGRNARKPKELELLRPDRMEIERDRETGEKTKYKYTRSDGKVLDFELDEIRHIKLFNPLDPERGLPITAAVIQAIELMEEGAEWNKTMLQNKGGMPGMFKYNAKMDSVTHAANKEALQKGFAEDSRHGRPGLLGGDVDFIPTAFNQKDADFTQLDAASVRKIAAGYGVDAALLGVPEARTHSNLEQAKQALFTDKVLPLLDFILDELNAWTEEIYGDGRYLGYDRDAIEVLQENTGTKYDRMLRATGRPILTVEEAREELGWKDSKEPLNRQFWVPFSLEPLNPVPRDENQNGAEQALSRAVANDEVFKDVLSKLTITENGVRVNGETT